MRLVPILITSVAALGAVALGHVYLTRLELEVGGGPKTTILVAAEDIPVGSVLKQEQLATRELPQSYLERRHIPITDSAKVVGTRLTAGLKASEALLWSDLYQSAGNARVLSGLVPHGMRAITVEANRASFDGLLRPGDRVDLLHSTSAGSGTTEGTRTLLQNLLVLAVGQDLGAATGSGTSSSPTRGSNVTLSCSLDQAQLIAEALRHGRLTTVLRSADDISLTNNIPITTASDVLAPKPLPTRPSTSGSKHHDAKGPEHVR